MGLGIMRKSAVALAAIVGGGTVAIHASKGNSGAQCEPNTTAVFGGMPADQLDGWEHRWSIGRTGWHQTQAHPKLIQYAKDTIIPSKTVLVPLCGKTLDIGWVGVVIDTLLLWLHNI